MAALDFLAAIEVSKGLGHAQQPTKGDTAKESPGKRVQEGPRTGVEWAFIEFEVSHTAVTAALTEPCGLEFPSGADPLPHLR